MTKEEAIALLQRYREGTCSDAEAKLVEQWYHLLEAKGSANWDEEQKNELDQELFERIKAEVFDTKADAIVVSKRKFSWAKLVAAAIFTGVGIFTWMQLVKPGKENRVAVSPPAGPQQFDADPGKTGAILTLANGEKIVLDTVSGGIIPVQGVGPVVNKNGTLTYQTDNHSGIIAYNTIVTPKGRQYRLMLADGTKVWLNAASSLHYPVSFTDQPRRIEVSGEAYFEVAEKRDPKGHKVPFIVKVVQEGEAPCEVQVLGTHFNINAYDDEPETKVTLLEGAVKVGKASGEFVQIKPGQQAKIRQHITIDRRVDIETVMAWKNGAFHFKNADIGAVMRQAERWYDIQVQYPLGVPADTLHGGISRDVKLSEFLDIIRYSDIRATIKDGVVEIKPAATGSK